MDKEDFIYIADCKLYSLENMQHIGLIERNIRQQMAEQAIECLPILPTGLNCKRPTWNNIRYFFRNIYLAMIVNGTKIISTKIKGMTELHKQLLDLLKIPEFRYIDLGKKICEM